LAEPRQAAGVHVLMLGRDVKRPAEWIAAAKAHPVLVVTDLAQGLERGAALCFVETDGRLRFEASVPAAEAAGLRLSSRLLALADKVVKAP
ncbi:MAG TPA: YfiR family protein, partial [Rhizobacter sp.]